MNHNYLKLALLVATMTAFTASGVKAQENTSKSSSIGPAIEFSNGSSAFGIKGNIGVGPQFSIRPMILFGYVNDYQGQLNNSPTTAPLLGGSGAAYGLAATYDFVAPDQKFTAYAGPRILFSNISTTLSRNGVQLSSLNANQTDIGLLIGGDYAISESFTIGANVIYNFSKTGNFTIVNNVAGTTSTGTDSFNNGSLDFGLNFAFRF